MKRVLCLYRVSTKGQVDQNGAKAHRQQQCRLHVAFDGQGDEHDADSDHHALLPGEVEHVTEQFV